MKDHDGVWEMLSEATFYEVKDGKFCPARIVVGSACLDSKQDLA